MNVNIISYYTTKTKVTLVGNEDEYRCILEIWVYSGAGVNYSENNVAMKGKKKLTLSIRHIRMDKRLSPFDLPAEK